MDGFSYLPPAKHVPDAADGVQQLSFVRFIDIATQPRDRDVDDVVERRGACRRVPYIARKHLTRHDGAAVAQEILKYLELLRGQVEGLCASRHLVRDQIHLELLVLQFEDLIHAPPAQQRPDARQQLGECEWLGEVVVGALVEADNPVFDRVLRRKDQYRCLNAAFAQRGEDIDAIAARQHEIEQQEVEGCLICQEEAFFSGGRDRDFVMLRLQARAQRIRDLRFILDNQNAHGVLRIESSSRGATTEPV